MTPTPHRRENASRAGYLTAWTLGGEAVGEIEEVSVAAERSVQASGEFGTAHCVLEGSNDGETFHMLTTLDGMAASFRRPGLITLREYCRFLRPRTAMGHEDTQITVTLMVRVER